METANFIIQPFQAKFPIYVDSGDSAVQYFSCTILELDFAMASDYSVEQPIESEPLSQFQPIRLQNKPKRKGIGCGMLAILILLGMLAAYFFTPFRTNFLLLGVDRSPENTDVGRTDTIILTGIQPLRARVTMLSIPRDLWISIPGVGENRINTVHFFAEANDPGSGPEAVLDVMEQQFGIAVRYYARIQLNGFPQLIDAMGGVDITLNEPNGIYAAGTHHLNGEEALAFVRNRSGADDFFRMANAQLMLMALERKMVSPRGWVHIPAVIKASSQFLDTNIPAWLLPRLGLAILRAGIGGIDNRTLPREMVTSHTTSGGAQVLLPDWNQILPLVDQLFGP